MFLPKTKQSYYMMMKAKFWGGITSSGPQHNPVDLVQKPLREDIQKFMDENWKYLVTFHHVPVCMYM